MVDCCLSAGTVSLPVVGELPLAGKVLEVAVVLVAVAIVVFLSRYCFLFWRGRSPRVQLSSIEIAMQEKDEQTVDPLWVSSLFREQLTSLKLSATEATPNAPAGAPLLEIVEGIGEGIGDKSQLGKGVGRLFRAIFPEAAYEVSGTMRPRKGGGWTISVQLVDRSHRHPTWVGTGEGVTWSEATHKAATGVAGALYPQVAHRHQGPWGSWRKPVPADLVALNDVARRHEKGNRLDQAMGTYQAALELDPLNPGLRLRIAMLHERLGLYLGAWATYRAIADETHRDSWKGGNRRIRLLALYRMAILLGNEEVAGRCICAAPDPGEERFKPELREALRAERPLVRASWWNRFGRLARRYPVGFVYTSPARLLDEELRRTDAVENSGFVRPAVNREKRGAWLNEQLGPKKDESEEAAVVRIRRLLEIVSLTHLEQLDLRLRRKPPWRPWRWRDWWRYRPGLRKTFSRRELSLSAVRVSKLVARIRIVASADPSSNGVVSARKRLQQRWPFSPQWWRLPARWLRPRHRVADRRDDAWQYHYNAACAVSRALSLGSTIEQTKVVDAGIKQLEEYVHRAGGDQVLAQIIWVAREDGDLAALRATGDYARWRNHHLPPLSEAQEQAAKVKAPRTAARIARHGARAFAERWRTRAGEGRIEPERVVELWAGEAEAWEALTQLLREHRSWEERWKAIATLQSCLRIDGEGEIDAARSAGASEGGHDMAALLGWLAGNSSERAEVALTAVASWALANAERAKSVARTGDTGRPGLDLRQDALRAARIWSRLGDALDRELVAGGEEPLEHTVSCLGDIQTEISIRQRPRPPDPSRVLIVSALDFSRQP